MNSLISLLNQKVATPGETYEISGDTFNLLKRLLIALWRGENIGSTATVKVQQNGAAGILLNGSAASKGGSTPPAWPWNVYNTTTGSTGQVQINGADGFVASLNGFVANVSGSPNDTPLSGPPNVYPQLPVTGNGVIYGYAVPSFPGGLRLASLDVYYGGTLPSLDTANPATYYPFLLATITSYATDGSGNVTFNVANATNYGWTTLVYCGAVIQIY